MRCRIEKKNYANRTGFTLNPTTTGEDLLFFLTAFTPVEQFCLFPVDGYNICKEKIDFSTRNVIYL
jgi:hypothetical protein